MKIYEITARTPNEYLIHQELRKLSEIASATTSKPLQEGFFSTAANAALKLLKAAGLFFLLKPFYTYFTNMSNANDVLKQSKNSKEAQMDYNEEHNIQMGLLISSLASALVTKIVFGSISSLLGFIRIIPGVGPVIANTINLLSAGAQTYVFQKIASEEGRIMLSKFLTFGTINGVKDVGALANQAVDQFSKMVQDAIAEADSIATGEPTKKPADAAATTEKPADQAATIDKPIDATATKPTATEKPANATATTNKPVDATATAKPSTNPADIAAQQASDKAQGYTPDRFKRNKQGDLVLKYADSD
jgi:hypothetical protein